MRLARTAVAAALCASLWAHGPAAAAALYDASLGTLPAAQGWTSGGAIASAPAVDGGFYTLDTLADNALQYGNVRAGVPGLDTATGFDLHFSLRVLSEAHAGAHRAGFSLIVAGTDPTRALELAFWTDSAWVYDFNGTAFTRGDSVSLDTTALRDYTLSVRAQQFSLRSAGSTLLQGSLRDYSASGHFAYTTPSLVFFGDDTSSARAAVQLGHITLTPVPEPAAAALLVPGLAGLAALARRSRRRA